MPNQYSMSIHESIAELQEAANKYQHAQEIDLALLIELTEKSHKLILRINEATLVADNLLLRELISKQLFVVTQLHNIAQNKELLTAPPPNELLGIITSSFEKFFNGIMSKKVQATLRQVVEFIPCVSGVVHCCETMPYYWTYASRAEKIGMILGATLIVTALALTLASYASPALAGVVVLGLSTMALCKVGTMLYREIIARPAKKYDDHLKLKATIQALDDQQQGVLIMAKRIFAEDKLDKQTLVFKEKPIKKMITKVKQALSLKNKYSKSKVKSKFPQEIHFDRSYQTREQAKRSATGKRSKSSDKGW